MRHKNAGRKLGRTPSHRKALFRNMAKALLIHGRITTTEAKAKSLRSVVEPLITLALRNDEHARRLAYRVLGEHKLVDRLFEEIGPLFVGGGGGYTRVLKLALPRKGDSAPMALIELTKRPEVKKAETSGEGKPGKVAPKVAKPVKEGSFEKVAKTDEDAPKKRAPRKKAEPKADA